MGIPATKLLCRNRLPYYLTLKARQELIFLSGFFYPIAQTPHGLSAALPPVKSVQFFFLLPQGYISFVKKKCTKEITSVPLDQSTPDLLSYHSLVQQIQPTAPIRYGKSAVPKGKQSRFPSPMPRCDYVLHGFPDYFHALQPLKSVLRAEKSALNPKLCSCASSCGHRLTPRQRLQLVDVGL